MEEYYFIEVTLLHGCFSLLLLCANGTAQSVSSTYKSSRPDVLPATLLKKRLWHRCFPVNFAKFLRTPFFTKHLWWLLLYFLIFLNKHDFPDSFGSLVLFTSYKCANIVWQHHILFQEKYLVFFPKENSEKESFPVSQQV